ncbi:hypothetical protein ROZALSC1DRAFT_27219 [Rozella allomycis CSF55]|uniref:Uncharacterized protein n=1 Tax=Rozella allomycis (strain CSF55) TaxID=988480 RepID=A0A075AW79_ROZAC|nr:hypothetical protein O9G_000599 [Rozella allomycis CSF55]RKP21375.1 hypothetical protein ROZALSC1DRAFT_27219 [Rozella allomycis CSF55]|eukprot:EPZ34412.1 hypothetical protein O9G_000599 [Rozella allomycis CSF55]
MISKWDEDRRKAFFTDIDDLPRLYQRLLNNVLLEINNMTTILNSEVSQIYNHAKVPMKKISVSSKINGTVLVKSESFIDQLIGLVFGHEILDETVSKEEYSAPMPSLTSIPSIFVSKVNSSRKKEDTTFVKSSVPRVPLFHDTQLAKQMNVRASWNRVFSHKDCALNLVEAISLLTLHSVKEDPYGLVHSSVPNILCAFLDFQQAMETYHKRVILHYLNVRSFGYQVLVLPIYETLDAFYEHMDKYNVEDHYRARIQALLDFEK